MTTAQAAAYLGVGDRYVRRLVAERRVSYYKVGKLVRFRRVDLDALLAGSLVSAQPKGRP